MDGEPLFPNKKQSRIMRLANKFDGLSELIDFTCVLKMTDETFSIFYQELQGMKWAIGKRIRGMANSFKSNNSDDPFKMQNLKGRDLIFAEFQ